MAHLRFRKILALALAIILALGMVPTPAFAEGGEVGSANGSNPPSYTPGGKNLNWITDNQWTPFSRYTLVYFGSGVDGENWKTNSWVISSIDISPKDYTQVDEEIYSFDTNAFWYRKQGMQPGKEYPAAFENAMHPGWKSKVRLESEIFNGDGTLPQGASTNFAAFATAAADMNIPPNGMLRYMFTGTKDGSEVQTQYNFALDNLIKAIGQKALGGSDQAPDLIKDGAIEFTSDDNYRLIVEPGMLIKDNGESKVYAVTLRDMAALSLYLYGEKGTTGLDQEQRKPMLDYSFSYEAADNLGLVLYETCDNFTVIEDGQLKSVSEPKAFSAAKEKEIGEQKNDGANHPKLMFKGLRRILFGLGTNQAIFSDGYKGCSWAEGEYAPYGMGIVLPRMVGSVATLNVAKKVAGDPADPNASFPMEVTFTGLNGGTVTSTTPGFSFAGDKATFSLKNNETCSMTVSGVTEGNEVKAEISETSAEGYTVSYEGATGDKHSVNLTSGNAATVTVTNTPSEASGVAHLIIDYNLDGTIATTGQGAEDTVACDAIPYDPDHPETNVVKDITPMINGEKLVKGSSKITKTFGGVTVTFTYKGLFDAPKGGNEVNGSYQLKHDGLTVLYVQWDVTTTSDPGPGPDPTPTPGTEAGNLYTIFWNLNYYGAGITSSLAGSFPIHRTLSCSLDEEGNHHVNYSDWTDLTVKIPFYFPGGEAIEGIPYRNGYTFMGWSTLLSAGYENGGTHGAAADALRDKGKTTGNPKDPTLFPPDPGKSTTYFAIWKAGDVVWNANGGYFDMSKDPSWPEDTSIWQYGTNDEGDNICTWAGWINYKDAVPILMRYPDREGYVFDTWYYDENGNVPIDETETGIIPGRTYWAGWIPQPVKVNYYDTRQGTSLITTQTYNYNDLFSLLGDLEDTDGQTFTGWKVKGSGEDASASGTHLVNGVMGMTYHDTGMGPISDKTNGYWEIDLEASWNEETVTYNGTISWDDYDNNDGLRPQAVHVGLVSSVGNQQVADTWVTGDSDAEDWPYQFTGLPVTTVDASVEKITYRTVVLGYRDAGGHEETIKDTGATSGVLLADLTDDPENEMTPTYIYSLDNISRDAIADVHWGVNRYNGTVYLDHELVRINYPFTILWEDNYDNDGFRPGFVRLNLYVNGVQATDNPYLASESSSVAVNKDGSEWTFVFPNLRKYYNEGELITYEASVVSLDQVNERVPKDGKSDLYTLAYVNGGSGNRDKNGVTFRRDTDKADYSGKIIWNDNDNRDGLRPEQVTVSLVGRCHNLHADTWETRTIDTITVTGGATAKEWPFTFHGEPEYSGGVEIEYTVALGKDIKTMSSDIYTWWTRQGFTAHVQEAPCTVLADGSSVLKISYTRNVYDVTFEVPLSAGTSVSHPDIPGQTVKFGDAFGPLPDPKLPGYNYNQESGVWYDADRLVTATSVHEKTGPVHLVARWNPNDNTNWAVKIAVRTLTKDENGMDVQGDTYQEYKTVYKDNSGNLLMGISDTTVTMSVGDIDALSIRGFHLAGYGAAFDPHGAGMIPSEAEFSVFVKPTDVSTDLNGAYNEAFNGGLVWLYYDRDTVPVTSVDGQGQENPGGDLVFGGDFTGHIPPDPGRDGYDFTGWVDKDGDPVDEDTEADDYVDKKDDVVITPTWHPRDYNLTYVPGPGASYVPAPGTTGKVVKSQTVAGGYIDPNTVTYDQPFGKLPTAAKPGYNFVEWQTDQGVAISETATVTINNVVISNAPTYTYENTRPLYAQFVPHTYTLVFYPGQTKGGVQGEVEPDRLTVTFGDIISGVPVPTLPGYRFVEWRRSVNRPETKVENGEVWNTVYTDGAEIPVYAVWVPETYRYDFDLNDDIGSTKGALVDTTIDYAEQTFDSVYEGVVSVEATRPGYVFDGWSLTPDGDVLTAEDLNETPEDTTVYAIWTPKEYTVTMYLNGGTTVDLTDNSDLDTYDPNAVYDVENDAWITTVVFDTTYGDLPTAVKLDCVYRGYEVYAPGWPDDTAFGPTIHGSIISALPQYIDYLDEPGITLSAVLEPYFVFDPDGGTFTEDGTRDPKRELQSEIDQLPAVEKDGYIQEGWVDQNGDKVNLEDLKQKTEPETLKPKFTATVTLDANGGTIDNAPTKTLPLNDNTTTLPTPKRPGYVFSGWYTEPTGGERVTLEDLKSANVPTTVYAQWTPQHGSGGGGGGGGGAVSYTVHFNSNGGSAVPDQTLTYGQKVTKPADPTRTGYVFSGWYSDANLKTAYDFSAAVRGSLTLYAAWEYRGAHTYLTDDHVAYIIGRSDGLVHPEANITRAEVATIFYRLLRDDVRAQYQTTASPYVDIPADSWYTSAVLTLTNMGILKGRGDKVFDPNAEITRAELAVISSRFDRLEDGDSPVTFPDVPTTYWAYQEIGSAAKKGWVVGRGDQKFWPDAPITRAEVMTLINRVLGRASITVESIITADPMTTWPDNADTAAWFYLAVQEATNAHTYETVNAVETWTSLRPVSVAK